MQPPVTGVGARLLRLVVALVVGGGAPGWTRSSQAIGQAPTGIGETLTCPRCSIRIEPEFILGTQAEPGMIVSQDVTARRHPDGRTFLAAFGQGGVLVFSKDGKYLQNLGRRGQGPGEFQAVSAIRFSLSGDIWVYDQSASRATVYSTELELIRTIPFQIPPSYAVLTLGQDQTLLSTPLSTPEEIGIPLHLMDTEGRLLRSFGGGDGFVHPGQPGRRTPKIIAPASDGAVWLGRSESYEIQKWRMDGKREYAVRRIAPWYALGTSRMTWEGPPKATLVDLQEDADGLLWTLVAVADSNWRDQYDGEMWNGEPKFVGTDEGLMDTRIELLDLSAGELLTQQTVGQYALSFIARGVIGGVIHRGNDMYYKTWRLAVRRE